MGPFPKRRVDISALASRGVTIVLDEYHTSLMCPCLWYIGTPGHCSNVCQRAQRDSPPSSVPQSTRCHKKTHRLVHSVVKEDAMW